MSKKKRFKEIVSRDAPAPPPEECTIEKCDLIATCSVKELPKKQRETLCGKLTEHRGTIEKQVQSLVSFTAEKRLSLSPENIEAIAYNLTKLLLMQMENLLHHRDCCAMHYCAIMADTCETMRTGRVHAFHTEVPMAGLVRDHPERKDADSHYG